MAFSDLRSAIAALTETNQLRRVKANVNWDLEIGSICRKVMDQRGPALLFENVRDSQYSLVTGVMDTFERYGFLIGCEPNIRSILKQVLAGAVNPIPTVTVTSAPCQEEVQTGDDIDLYKFPTPRWHSLDNGRYIGTLGLVITKDPETGVQNTGIYRLEVQGKNKTGYNATQQTGIPLRKYEAMGKPMPIAIALGVDPASLAASCVGVVYGQDEFAVAGGIRGSATEMVKCKTVDIEVPATAEIILEGWVSPRREDWVLEGPFGEFTGYYGLREKNPVINLSAITHRKNPILQGTLEGKPPSESATLRSLGHTIGTWSKLKKSGVPGVKEVWMSDMGGCNFSVVVSVDRLYYHGNARQIMDVIWGSYFNAKWITIVDSDIDIYNRAEVEWAICQNVEPHRDIVVTANDHPNSSLDPASAPQDRLYPNSRGSKIGIDATTQYKGFDYPPRIRLSADEIALVERRWQEYGID